MLPLLLGAGVSGLLGGLMTNRASAKAAERQMDFQEEMSNTAYQRAVADMKAAGINPMLVSKVGGASTPPGAVPEIRDVVSSGMTSGAQAVGMAQGLASVDQSAAQADLLKAQATKVRSETMDDFMQREMFAARLAAAKTQGPLGYARELTEAQRAELLKEQRNRLGIDIDLANSAFMYDVARRKAESELSQFAVPGARASAKFFSSDLGEMNPYMRQALELLKGVSSAVAHDPFSRRGR